MCLAALCGLACGPQKENVPIADTAVEQPFQEIDTTVMCFYNGGTLSWKLESNHLRRFFADTGHVFAHPVKLTVYDSAGKEMSKVLSDSGSTDGPMKQFCVWGNVFVKAQNGVRVKAQKLFWSLTTHKVTSGDYVQIKTVKGDVLRGKGLDAAEDFSWWQFAHDVSGRFPNFKERVEKGGEF